MPHPKRSYKYDICHIASAHSRYDTRIGVKFCKSLLEDGYRVSFVVADGLANETFPTGLDIISAPRYSNRILRMLCAPLTTLLISIRNPAKIYHMHDPELLPAAVFIKLFVRESIFLFDSHEDVPEQIRYKEYLPKFLRYILSRLAKTILNILYSSLDGLTSATPHITSKLLKVNNSCITVANYPLPLEYDSIPPIDLSTPKNLIYIGNIGKSRGIFELLDVLNLLDDSISLELVGSFAEPDTYVQACAHPAWHRTNFHGWLKRNDILPIIERSFIGIVTLHPLETFKYSLPVKLFEYMASGRPIVASNFPSIAPIVEKNNCGLLVNPLSVKEIKNAVDFLFSNPQEAINMAKRGKYASVSTYNWQTQYNQLCSYYRRYNLDL